MPAFEKGEALILPNSSGQLAKRVISKSEVSNENPKSRNGGTNCPQQIVLAYKNRTLS
jgi:hypothetical protein